MSKPLFRPAAPLDDASGLHLLPLSVLLLQTFGPNFLLWDSPVLKAEVRERFGEPGPVTWERIQAGRVMASHDAFWKEWEVFENCCAAIVGDPPVFSFMQPPESEEVAVALITAQRINEALVFDEDVLAYMTAACMHDGLWYYESPLDILTPVLLQHDREKGIQRDFGGVGEVLSRSDAPIKEPSSASEVQANNVISVRRVVEDYLDEVDSQMDTIPALVRRFKRSA